MYYCRTAQYGIEEVEIPTAEIDFEYMYYCRTAQYGIEEVEIATAVIDLEDIRTYRNLNR